MVGATPVLGCEPALAPQMGIAPSCLDEMPQARAAMREGVNPCLAFIFDMPLEEVDRLGGGPDTRPFGSF